MSEYHIELNDTEFKALERGAEVVCEIQSCLSCGDGETTQPVSLQRSTRPAGGDGR